MPEINETPRNVLVAVLSCTIIGIIAFAGFDTGTPGQRTRGLPVGSKIPAIHDETRQFLP